MSSLQGDDEEENAPEEGEHARMFSRRKLESNWDRYQASEKVECDDDTPTVRGTDFDVLLAAAGKIPHWAAPAFGFLCKFESVNFIDLSFTLRSHCGRELSFSSHSAQPIETFFFLQIFVSLCPNW